MNTLLARALIGLSLILTHSAYAQIPPEPAEIEAYGGLLAAAAKGDVADIERLIAAGEKPTVTDKNRRTPLHIAVFGRHQEAARALLRLGADANALDAQKYDPVTVASVANDVPMLKLLLEGGASAANITSPYNGTALIAAAHLGHAEIVRTLIAAKAPLDHVNNLGWTALMESIVLGDGGPRHTETLDALVKAGANVNIPDRQGATPLVHAHHAGHLEMLKILRAAGAKERP